MPVSLHLLPVPVPCLHSQSPLYSCHCSINKFKPSKLLVSRAQFDCSKHAFSTAEAASVQGGEINADLLPEGLSRDLMPRHVAVVMDGSGRWAKARGLPPSAGHQEGVRVLKEMIKLSCKWGIRVLTVFAFSAENWLRPKAEVDFLIRLFENFLRVDIDNLVREDIRLCVIGDSSRLPESLQNLISEAEEMTKNNMLLDLIVAVSYSGRNDIVQACQKIAGKVKDGLLEPGDITESVIEKELETNCASDFPCPDLLIRTSEALCSFQHRHRRFGGRI